MIDGPNGQNSTSDDEFDRAIRSLTDGTAGKARYRELSAADREKQARRQARSAHKQGRGNRRGNRIRVRVKQAGIRITTAVLVAGLVTGGAWYAMRQFHGTGHPAGLAAAKPPTASPVRQGPPADPFAGSPAEGWADGAKAIVVPLAKPVGSYSAAQVAAAYATAKKLLIAGELTKSVLLGGRPSAYAALLPAQQRKTFLGGLNATGKYKNGADRNTHVWVTAFAPGSTDLVGTVIKVRGQLTATAAVKFGDKVLDVHVNYLFAYAVEPPGHPAGWLRLVMHREDDYYFGHWDGSQGPLTPWAEPESGGTPALCGPTDGYVHPDFAKSSGGNGAAVDPYSLKHDSTRGCRNALPT